MSRFFKSAAFPIIIVIVLAFFASRLISNADRAEPTTFGEFLTQIEQQDRSSPSRSTRRTTRSRS